MKKVLYFILMCLYVLGTIGGVGYSIHGGSWPIAIGVCVIALVAFPTVKGWFKELVD